MTTEEITLNVGDKLYYLQLGLLRHKITIDRITDKTAFSGNIKFKREQEYNYYIRAIGSDTYSGHYSLETPELLAEYTIKQKRQKASEAFNKLAKSCHSADEETINKYLEAIKLCEK